MMGKTVETKQRRDAPQEEMVNRELWTASAKPIAVLVVICAAVGLLLGSVNNLTLPVITANREAEAWATYSSLIPDAPDFSALPCDVPGVTACMEAAGGTGYVVTAQAKGYSGPVPMGIAFGSDGIIVNVVGLKNTETPGLGTKVADEEFSSQFVGRAAEPLTISDIDAVTGATISSKAALAAVNEAIEAFRGIAMGQDAAVPAAESGKEAS